jgi:hypothetical protein
MARLATRATSFFGSCDYSPRRCHWDEAIVGRKLRRPGPSPVTQARQRIQTGYDVWLRPWRVLDSSKCLPWLPAAPSPPPGYGCPTVPPCPPWSPTTQSLNTNYKLQYKSTQSPTTQPLPYSSINWAGVE